MSRSGLCESQSNAPLPKVVGMTGHDDTQDQNDRHESAGSTAREFDDYPVGSVASPTRTRL